MSILPPLSIFPARITAFNLENFRSYKRVTLPLAPLTLLVGANASGKSNAIEGLRLLSAMAKGQYLTDAFRTLQKEQAIRGTLEDLIYENNSTFALGCSLVHAYPGFPRTESWRDWRDFAIQIEYDGKELVVARESISYTNATYPLYRVERQASPYSHELEISYNNFTRDGKKPRIVCDNRQAIFTQLTTPARFSTAKAQERIPKVTQSFRRTLEHILFLDPRPRRMRDYSFITDKDLKGDGSNLSSVLYNLCEEQNQKKRILDFIQSLPEQDIRDLSFLRTPRNEVMVRLAESFGGRTQERDAPILSDGTLRVLAVAAALLSAPQGYTVVVEEIDNGVHPSRAGMLLENIQLAAKERDLRVLITTHNPALLDALPLEAIPDVVYCYRDPLEGDSRLSRLESLPDYSELIAQGPVGGLMTRGILERYLKRVPRTKEEKIAEALAWLERLEMKIE